MKFHILSNIIKEKVFHMHHPYFFSPYPKHQFMLTKIIYSVVPKILIRSWELMIILYIIRFQ